MSKEKTIHPSLIKEIFFQYIYKIIYSIIRIIYLTDTYLSLQKREREKINNNINSDIILIRIDSSKLTNQIKYIDLPTFNFSYEYLLISKNYENNCQIKFC